MLYNVVKGKIRFFLKFFLMFNISTIFSQSYYSSNNSVSTSFGLIVLSFIVFPVLLFYSFFVTVIIFKKSKTIRKNKEDYDSKKEKFYKIVHEMRIPSNEILGLIYHARKEIDIPTLYHYLDEIEHSSKFLLGLINDTIDIHTIEYEKEQINFEPVNLRDFILTTSDLFKQSILNKKINFNFINKNVDLDSYVIIDPVRLRQVFMNIFQNSIKYVHENGNITFSIECLKQQNGINSYKFQIIDNGIGMSEYAIKSDFFSALEKDIYSKEDSFFNSSLNLAITKKIVEMLGGNIEVASELGKGSCFSIYFNFQVISKTEVVSQSENEVDKKFFNPVEILSGRSFLICEDNKINSEITRRLLEKAGCFVDVAENGKIGCQKFRESQNFHYDMILMDIRMPEMDGLQATEVIRSLNRFDSKIVPIIALTANEYKTDIEQTQKVGMNAHITKPIDPQKFYSVIAENINEA